MSRVHEIQALKAESDACGVQQMPPEGHWCPNDQGSLPEVQAGECIICLSDLKHALSHCQNMLSQSLTHQQLTLLPLAASEEPDEWHSSCCNSFPGLHLIVVAARSERSAQVDAMSAARPQRATHAADKQQYARRCTGATTNLRAVQPHLRLLSPAALLLAVTAARCCLRVASLSCTFLCCALISCSPDLACSNVTCRAMNTQQGPCVIVYP